MTTVDSDVIATGELVRIRAKRLEDARLDWMWRTDAELAELDAATVSPLTFEQFRNQYEWQLRRTSIYRCTFAVEAVADGCHIGNVMYYNVDRIRRQAELGVIIGDREYWGAGYGREAVALLVDYIFTHSSLTRVYLHTLDWNVRAQRAFRAVGFRDCGRVRRGRHRFHQMQVLREWRWQQDYQRRAVPRRRGR